MLKIRQSTLSHRSFSFIFIVLMMCAVWSGMKSSAASGDGDAGLQSLAKGRDFYIGTAVAADPLKNDPAYREMINREFNICVAENAFKFESMHPARAKFDFTETDSLVEFAEANGLRLRGHTLVWHRQIPAWLTQGNFTRDETISILKEHITTFVKRYEGKIWAWDVVNEAVSEDGKRLRVDSFWHQKIGPDYLKLAFQFAHEADPKALLYYNDFSAEDMSDKSKRVYQLVRELKQQGAPIHGVGWQMHLQSGFKIKNEHRENADRLAELGLEISVTELDIRAKTPITPEDLAKQAASYHEVANFCLTQPNCKALVMWGFTDKHSWIPGVFPDEGDALIFNAEYQPKLAYQKLKAAFLDVSNAGPKVTNVAMNGEDLVVTGENFGKDATVIVNWKRQKTTVDKQQPAGKLVVKEASKTISQPQSSAKSLVIQVQNPDKKLSTEHVFRP